MTSDLVRLSFHPRKSCGCLKFPPRLLPLEDSPPFRISFPFSSIALHLQVQDCYLFIIGRRLSFSKRRTAHASHLGFDGLSFLITLPPLTTLSSNYLGRSFQLTAWLYNSRHCLMAPYPAMLPGHMSSDMLAVIPAS